MLEQQSPIIITRKARIWPEIPKDTITLPSPPAMPTPPQATMLTTVAFSLVSMAVYALVFTRNGAGGSTTFILPFIAISGVMALSSVARYITQVISVRRRSKILVSSYKKKLEEAEKQLQFLRWQEQQASVELDPPFIMTTSPAEYYEHLDVTALIQRSLNERDLHLWSRRPDDPDFLSVRLGIGNRQASFSVKGSQNSTQITMPSKLDSYNEYARTLLEKYDSLAAPLTVKLDGFSPVSIVGSQQKTFQARELARAMLCQLVYHHSPEDVRVIVMAPQSQEMAWQWTTVLPHTRVYDPRQSGEEADEVPSDHAVATSAEAIINLLSWISRELGRRELIVGDTHQPSKMGILPHLVIVIDHFEPQSDLDQPTQLLPAILPGQVHTPVQHRLRLSVSPLKRPEMTVALGRGTSLGVSVLCICANKVDVPTNSGIMVDLDVTSPPKVFASYSTTELLPQAHLRVLRPDPPPILDCMALDTAPVDALRFFASRMKYLRAVNLKRLELRTQVDLRTLFEPPLDLVTYDPLVTWYNPAFRASNPAGDEVPLMRIPVGLKIGDEVQYLDFLKDGPHGLLIGQTGSGKSELLQTIIMALAITYRPTEVNFLLIDYKAGLALEPFRTLPHTIGFLSNVSSPALIQRFITMLRAEATRRELRMKEGKATPRLVIIIDEFAEMAKRTEAVLDELFTITRVGREIGMHLLLSAQRPDGIISSKVRDYVQYRLCLRCVSPEDSREVLRRIDAANLPASIPGRGYLLHGDNQLDLFQAARVTMPAPRTQGQFLGRNDLQFAQNGQEKIPSFSTLASMRSS